MKSERIRSVWELVDLKKADDDGTRTIAFGDAGLEPMTKGK